MLLFLKPLKWLLKIVSAVVAIALVYWIIIFLIVWNASTDDERAKSDAIIVMGAAQYDGKPSPDLQGRLDHALVLWKAKVAPKIVVTGGKQPLDRFTEAEASARYLHRQGVPDTAILRENQGRSSWESLQASARFLKRAKLTHVTLVSDAYHSARIVDIAEAVGLHPQSSPSRLISGSKQVKLLLRESLRVAAGRVVGYDTLERHQRVGDLIPGLAIMPMLSIPGFRRRQQPIRG